MVNFWYNYEIPSRLILLFMWEHLSSHENLGPWGTSFVIPTSSNCPASVGIRLLQSPRRLHWTGPSLPLYSAVLIFHYKCIHLVLLGRLVIPSSREFPSLSTPQGNAVFIPCSIFRSFISATFPAVSSLIHRSVTNTYWWLSPRHRDHRFFTLIPAPTKMPLNTFRCRLSIKTRNS